MRRLAIAALLAVIAATGWYIWHVTTVDLPLVTAPAELVELPRPVLDRRPMAVWIDADPACGTGRRRDVDDCWAIAAALLSPELSVRGITTVFGNSDPATSVRVATTVCRHFGSDLRPIAGAAEAGQHAHAAVDALAQALRREKLLILSLGPATNLAALLRTHPSLKSQILGVIAIAGGDETAYFELGKSQVFHAHDQNFRRDVAAFQTLLDARVPLVLVPYATVTKVEIRREDLRHVDPWLAGESREWAEYWSSLSGSDSFVPFDAVATALAIRPDEFRIERRTVQIRRPVSHAPEQYGVASRAAERGWVVGWAADVTPRVRTFLSERLTNRE